ncbi:hypothetical protein JYU34_008467 [Plutella xylostella]|uniref:Regulatory protein zeste n=1 Tax=Plutella xylostella TaxID=51655 RepID=A0ABQ7QLJ7_PLUXY|nr:hypothetical protein JYU34_008467 [Plutella xylostella]
MDQPLEKVKRQYPSVAQKLRLSQLLEADEELRNGKFTATFSKKTASERWEKIALELNSLTGAKKSGKEWRTTWGDMKTYTKKKYAGQRRSMQRTGGGPPDIQPEAVDQIILSTISESALSGHSDSQESSARLINFHHEPTNDSENVQIIVIEPPATDPPAIEPVPGTSSETTEPPATDPPAMEPVPGTSSENTQRTGRPRPKRTVAQRRLENSLQVAGTMNETLEKKIQMKKQFNEAYLIEMRRRTDAIIELSNSIKQLSNNNNHV